MMLFFLDRNFERVNTFTDWTSLIWADRWNNAGDFELKVPYTAALSRVMPGYFVESTESESIMLLETIEVKKDQEDSYVLFKGRSVDILLNYIVLIKTMLYTGSPESITAEMLRYASNYDKYKVTFGRDYDSYIFNSGAGTSSDMTMSYETDDTSVFSQMQNILKTTESGWSVTLKKDIKKFDLRIDKIRENKDILLSTGADDFESFNIVRSISDFYNTAITRYTQYEGDETKTYYMPVKTTQTATYNNLSSEVVNRSLIVDATDVDHGYSSNEQYLAGVRGKALAELSDKKYENSFDGKVNPIARYTYGRDYKLGDIISVNHENTRYSALVTEYIWASDSTGTTNYPTLSFR